MKLFDPHIRMTSRTTDDYQAMADAGIAAVVEPAFWLGQPRTHVATFEDYFAALVGWERFRASQFGIRHFCTMGLNPKEANNPELADAVLRILPRWLEKDGVVAVGEIGYDDMTAAEDRYLGAQLELAKQHRLPVLVHTPHRDKKRGTARTLALLREVGFPEEQALIDHNNEETLPLVLATGCWAGHSIYPNTKMDEARMVTLIQRHGSERILVNSAADWGISDPLKVPKTAAALRAAGVAEAEIETVVWRNPVRFFAQSGRLDLADDATAEGAPLAPPAAAPIDRTALHEGNSILRGQAR
jgi:predicted metal-dependent TIM-barrel fold hydrolase